jgi:hypothetical protein
MEKSRLYVEGCHYIVEDCGCSLSSSTAHYSLLRSESSAVSFDWYNDDTSLNVHYCP